MCFHYYLPRMFSQHLCVCVCVVCVCSGVFICMGVDAHQLGRQGQIKVERIRVIFVQRGYLSRQMVF